MIADVVGQYFSRALSTVIVVAFCCCCRCCCHYCVYRYCFIPLVVLPLGADSNVYSYCCLFLSFIGRKKETRSFFHLYILSPLLFLACFSFLFLHFLCYLCVSFTNKNKEATYLSLLSVFHLSLPSFFFSSLSYHPVTPVFHFYNILALHLN